jgi:hypothetical protein
LPEEFLNFLHHFYKPIHFGLGVVKIKTRAGASISHKWPACFCPVNVPTLKEWRSGFSAESRILWFYRKLRRSADTPLRCAGSFAEG